MVKPSPLTRTQGRYGVVVAEGMMAATGAEVLSGREAGTVVAGATQDVSRNATASSAGKVFT
jgi:hypothetical protein